MIITDKFIEYLIQIMNELGHKDSQEFEAFVDKAFYYDTNVLGQKKQRGAVKRNMEKIRRNETKESIHFNTMNSLVYGLISIGALKIRTDKIFETSNDWIEILTAVTSDFVFPVDRSNYNEVNIKTLKVIMKDIIVYANASDAQSTSLRLNQLSQIIKLQIELSKND
jgi:hypothetical protein